MYGASARRQTVLHIIGLAFAFALIVSKQQSFIGDCHYAIGRINSALQKRELLIGSRLSLVDGLFGSEAVQCLDCERVHRVCCACAGPALACGGRVC